MPLTTDYLGLRLNTPFIIGASPLCDHVQLARRLEDAGAGAVVMRSLFKEQIHAAAKAAAFEVDSPAEPAESFPEFADYQFSPEQYLRQLEALKRNLSIPVIASLNGYERGAWIDIAARLEQAGADAIELNFYRIVADPSIAADQVEIEMLEVVELICESVRIPVSVKLSPFHTAMAQLVVALELAGASGVVLFNRFYQPDINVDDLEVQPLLRLSDPQELLLRLRWLAILSPQVRGSLAATGGVHTSAGAIKAILTGANAVQLVSVVLKHGPGVISTLIAGMQSWMRGRGYANIDDFRGALNSRRYHDAAAFERANYIRTLQSWKV